MRTVAFILALLPAVLGHNAGQGAHRRATRRSGGNPANAAHKHDLVARQAVAGVTGALGGIIGGGTGAGGTTGDDDDDTASSVITTTSRAVVVPSTTSAVVVVPTTSRITTTSAVTSRVSSIASGTTSSLSSSITGSVSSSMSASASMNSTSTSISASNSSAAPSSTSSMSQSVSMSVDAAGKTVVITQFLTAPVASVSTTTDTASSAAATDDTQSKGNSISTGAIAGIAVGVGAVVLALLGCAIWRMKKRAMDDDDAIRWPELNRHGDTTVNHALPARATGKHGIETDPLERVRSNDSDPYDQTSSHGHGMTRVPAPMALNGSSFGAPSNLDYDEKAHAGYDWPGSPPYAGYPAADSVHAHSNAQTTSPRANHQDLEDDYTSYPPPMVPASQSPAGAGLYESSSEEDLPRSPPPAAVSRSTSAGRVMAVANPDPVSYRL